MEHKEGKYLPLNGVKRLSSEEMKRGFWIGGEPIWHKEWMEREGTPLQRAIDNAEVFTWHRPNNELRKLAGLPDISDAIVAERMKKFGIKK